MIYDILDVFKKRYDEKGDKIILDRYELKEGFYVRINKKETIECFIVKKKNKELIFTDIDGNLNFSAYQWFKERDYYSSYLNSNKSFFDKKIHNVNYFSLFVKIDSFVDESKKLKIQKRLNDIAENNISLESLFLRTLPSSLIDRDFLEEILDENEVKKIFKEDLFKKLLTQQVLKYHYLALCNYKKFTKSKEKEILESFQKYLRNRERKKDILKKYRFIKNNLDSIVDIARQNNVKNYIKIFFDEPVERYRKESEIYYSIKIFNDIKYSEKIENQNFGLSNSNMGLNSKKPFLEHKTKLRTVPFLITNENALFLKKFFDWLKIQPYKDEENHNKPIDRYLDDSFFMQKHSANDEAEITDFDYILLKFTN